MNDNIAKPCYRIIRCVSVLFLAITFTFVCLYPPDAGAQRAGDDGDERKTKQTAAMSEKVYKRLTEAQEIIEAQKYTEGLAILNDLLNLRSLTAYERAQIYSYFAYTYFTMERYKDAINAYENVLKQPDIPIALVMNSTYTLAQLYFIQEDYRQAIRLINDWFKLTDKPTETAYMLLGQAYYQLEQYKESLVPLMKAYNLVKGRGDNPKENLLLLLRVNYFNLNDYKNMIAVLKELVDLYPKSEYWLTMGGAYSEMKQLKKQMSIFEMLYEHGDLHSGNQQLNLANLYLLHEVPFKAANVLDAGIKSGEIKREVRNLRLLSQAWLQAQESEKSIAPLKEAAAKSSDGELELRLAQAYINLDRYREAVEALNRGLKKGKLRRPDTAYTMLGMAQFELKNFNSALRAFSKAAEDKRSAKSANQWIKYVQTEMDREKQLEESLNARRSM